MASLKYLEKHIMIHSPFLPPINYLFLSYRNIIIL